MGVEQFNRVVREVLNTRNFLGNEYQAYLEFCHENSITPNENDWLDILIRVEKIWRS